MKREQEKEEEGKEELNLWVFDNCYTCSQQKVERKTRGEEEKQSEGESKM